MSSLPSPTSPSGWLEGFQDWTNGIPSPLIFRKWSGIYAIGSAVERKIWMRAGGTNRIYPNLFMFLVGPPGVGKTQSLVPMANVLRVADVTRFAPTDVSKASLMDALSKAQRAVPMPAGIEPPIMEYHYLSMVIRELSNFMNQYDSAIAGLLTDIYDNPPYNEELKRTSKGSGTIVNPSLSMIAGTATKNLGKTISGDLWGQGFMSRVILVYSGETPFVDIFADDEKPQIENIKPPADLVDGLREIGMMRGPMTWDKAAQAAFTAWRKDECRPFPGHSKLVEYNARRWLHVAKLSMISALSNGTMTVQAYDFERARAWLEQAEGFMPEIFKEMVIHADGEVLRELHMYIWGLYAKHKKPVHASQMYSFLSTKMPHRDITRLIEVGETAGLFDRMAGTQGVSAQYVPKQAVGNLVFDT